MKNKDFKKREATIRGYVEYFNLLAVNYEKLAEKYRKNQSFWADRLKDFSSLAPLFFTSKDSRIDYSKAKGKAGNILFLFIEQNIKNKSDIARSMKTSRENVRQIIDRYKQGYYYSTL